MTDELPKTEQFTGASIVIAAMNETYSLRQTVETIQKLCNHQDLAEILIVVCKRTTPECLAVAEELRKASENAQTPVRIYCQMKPFVGMAYREAFDIVIGSHAVMMSADLETPPEVIPEYIHNAKLHSNDITTGSRWIGDGSFEGYSKVKWLCNWLFQKMIASLFLCKNSDLTYGYRIFPRKIIQSISWKEEKHPFFLETALIPLRFGIRFHEVPIQWKARTEGDSVNSFWANFKYFKTALRVRFSRKNNLLRKDNDKSF